MTELEEKIRKIFNTHLGEIVIAQPVRHAIQMEKIITDLADLIREREERADIYASLHILGELLAAIYCVNEFETSKSIKPWAKKRLALLNQRMRRFGKERADD